MALKNERKRKIFQSLLCGWPLRTHCRPPGLSGVRIKTDFLIARVGDNDPLNGQVTRLDDLPGLINQLEHNGVSYFAVDLYIRPTLLCTARVQFCSIKSELNPHQQRGCFISPRFRWCSRIIAKEKELRFVGNIQCRCNMVQGCSVVRMVEWSKW